MALSKQYVEIARSICVESVRILRQISYVTADKVPSSTGMMSQVRELKLTNMAPKSDSDDEDVTESDDERPSALQELTA